MTAPRYDLSTLTAAVSKKGDLCRKPCPEVYRLGGTKKAPVLFYEGQTPGHPTMPFAEHPIECEGCHGTGKVHNPADPIFQALWRESNLIDHGRPLGYHPRPREQTALRLPEALRASGIGYNISWNPVSDDKCVSAMVWEKPGEETWEGEGGNDLDALAAALMAWMDAQK